MASLEKFTDEEIVAQLGHNSRAKKTYRNKDIDLSKSHQNYSFKMDHGNLTPLDFYKKRMDQNYIYGRGTKREKEAVTTFGWVVTLPAELAGDPEKEKAFFKGVYDFISGRYGSQNIISNDVHYDEAGLPHIHVVVMPSLALDPDKVHYKIARTKKAVRTETGRYEYAVRFAEKDGERIPVKNYARMADFFSEKLSANDVLNKAELQHFHGDLQTYLTANGIEGKVVTGTTGGISYSVEELKEFTQKTGLTLTDVKERLQGKSLLEGYIESTEKVNELEAKVASLEEQLDKTRTWSADRSSGGWGDRSWGQPTGWGTTDTTKNIDL